MFTIRKEFKFEMAHQLKEAYSECCSGTIHGHSYICQIYFSSEELDETGMVIDFGEVKALIGDYIDEWDHALVMPSTMDQHYLSALSKYNKQLKIVDYNPTAENMAKDIYEYVKKIVPACSKVRLYETQTGCAEYSDAICCKH